MTASSIASAAAPRTGRRLAGAMGDPFRLQRFVDAQDHDGTYEAAVGELRAGRKRTHWMWFVFPQFAGLGHSPISRTYAIGSLREARAYLEHPVLGPRLQRCAELVTAHRGFTAEQIFGAIDAIKLRSSMTLFARADPDEARFQLVLDDYFDGHRDDATIVLLETAG
jgi:uncharacterized protein (DUF1810 family)